MKYRVLNHLGWSALSPFASLLAAGVPTKPSQPQMVSVTAAEIELSFSEVLDNGGSPITSYVLFVRAESSSTSSEVTTYLGSAMSHTLTVADDSLVVGETHFFSLLARNDVGDSELSDESSFAVAPLPA
jgi:hypothetical protein